ncbi:hypothetical protein ACIA8O_10890 [Kitasatospora sp. NPDC051853]|uniref:hypothetical protein n=1 Tax=Kitasatospora sp. NPDC051853 TaxID=3364058 RepID=UPI0037B0320B
MRKNVFKRATAVLLSAAAIALAAPAVTASAAPAEEFVHLKSGQRLNPGETLRSGDAALVMQWDGNLVLRLVNDQGQLGPEAWASGTYNNWAAYAYMQPDGNLVIYRQNGGPDQGGAVWHTGSWGHQGAELTMLGGQLSISDPSSYQRLWSLDAGFNPVRMGDGASQESFINQNRGALTAGQWLRSNSVWLLMQQDGNLVLYRKRDGAALWSTGTYGKPDQALFVANTKGNMYLRGLKNGVLTWTLSVPQSDGAYARLQNDGNFVLYTGGGQPLWSSGTYGNW